MSDLIDRQAAITIPIPPKWNRKYLTTNLDDAYELGWDDCQKCIEALPSAQPEIIHCRDCKHRGEEPIADGRYWCEIHDTFMYYCSDAERRTDE